MGILSTLRSSLRVRVGNPTTGDVPESILTDIVNRSYHQISDRFRFYKTRKLCSFDTIASQQKYDLPSASLIILSASDTTNRVELDRKDDEWYLNNQWNGATTGKPVSYIRYRGWIRLSPVPDAAYSIQIYYRFSVDNLVADADTTVIPSEWDEGLLLLGRAIFYDDKQDMPKAQYAYNVYTKWLETKPDEMDEELSVLGNFGVQVPTKTRGRARLDFDHTP